MHRYTKWTWMKKWLRRTPSEIWKQFFWANKTIFSVSLNGSEPEIHRCGDRRNMSLEKILMLPAFVIDQWFTLKKSTGLWDIATKIELWTVCGRKCTTCRFLEFLFYKNLLYWQFVVGDSYAWVSQRLSKCLICVYESLIITLKRS